MEDGRTFANLVAIPPVEMMPHLMTVGAIVLWVGTVVGDKVYRVVVEDDVLEAGSCGPNGGGRRDSPTFHRH